MDSKIDKVRKALEIADAFCGKHTADECPDAVAIPIKDALSALSAIDPEVIRREFWDELHAEAEAQYDHRHDVLRPVKTYAQSMIVHTMDDGWSAWLLAKRIIENRKAREFNL